jgi:hypothetical protein
MIIVIILYNNNKMNFLIEDLYSTFYGTVDTDSASETDDDDDDDTASETDNDTVGTVGNSATTVGNTSSTVGNSATTSTSTVGNTVIEKPEIVCKCDVSKLVSVSHFKEITSKMEKALQEYKTTQDKLKGELSKCIYNIRDIKKSNRTRITLLNYLLYMSNLHSVMCLVCTHNNSSHNCRMSYTMVPRFRSGGGSVFNYNSLTTFVMSLDEKCLNYFSNINLQYINDRLASYNNIKESDKYIIFNEALETDKLVYNMLWKVKKDM